MNQLRPRHHSVDMKRKKENLGIHSCPGVNAILAAMAPGVTCVRVEVFVCVRTCACMRACVCVRVCVRLRARVRVPVCARAYVERSTNPSY